MKTIWQGSISFGLVNIPIKLYSAIDPKSVSFRLLHKKDHSPIKYKRFCEKEGKEVKWNDIVKGIEINKGVFKTFTNEELKNLKPAKSDNIEVFEFIDQDQIDAIYFDSHYFLAPDKKSARSYFLFKEVLQTTGKIAIGRFIMREKEYIAAISSYKSGLLLTKLNYAYEVRDIEEIEELGNAPKLKPDEIKLAKSLIDQLYEEEFDMGKFKDTFREQLKDLIEGKKIKKIEVAPTRESNLIKALRASLK